MNPKHPLLSMTIWGAIIAALPALFALLGVPWPEGLGGDLQEAAGAAITLAGSVLAIVGRFRAKRPLSTGTEAAPALLLGALMLPMCLMLAGCGTAAGFGKAPKSAELWLQGIKAKEMTATISSPAFQVSIQATDFDSRTEGTNVVNAAVPPGGGELPEHSMRPAESRPEGAGHPMADPAARSREVDHPPPAGGGDGAGGASASRW